MRLRPEEMRLTGYPDLTVREPHQRGARDVGRKAFADVQAVRRRGLLRPPAAAVLHRVRDEPVDALAFDGDPDSDLAAGLVVADL